MSKKDKKIEEEKIEEVEEKDILDLLLDENNNEPIVLYDEDDKAVHFEQVAIIPENKKIYAILKPIDKLEGVKDDEAIVFLIDFDEDGNSILIIEEDEQTSINVFDKYYKLIEDENKKNN